MKVREAVERAKERMAAEAGGAATTGAPTRLRILRLPVGGRAKIRFLREFGDGIVLLRHRRRTKPYFVSCWRNAEYGGHSSCKYCDEAPPREEWIWPVYNYDAGQVELVSWRRTAFTPVAALEMFDAEGGTITDRDMILTRVAAKLGGAMDDAGRTASQWTLLPSAPTPLSVEVPTVRDREILHTLRPWEE